MDDIWKEWESGEPVEALETEPSAPPSPYHNEQAFQDWYGRWANIAGIDPNPDHPAHQYDYRAAYNAGVEPTYNEQDGAYHWDSRFKAPMHPNRMVNGVDTTTGDNVVDEWQKATPVKAEEYDDPNEEGDFLGGLGKLAKAAPRLGEHMAETTARSFRGGRMEAYEEGLIDKYLAENKLKRAQEDEEDMPGGQKDKLWFRMPFTKQRVTYGDAVSAVENIGYSIANMVGTMGAGAAMGAALGAMGANPATVVAGAATGAIATGTIYSAQATKDQFVDEFYDAFLRAYPNDTPENRELWRKIRKEIDSDADWYGFWEAFPETVGNYLTMGIAGIGKKSIEGLAGKSLLAPLKEQIAKAAGSKIVQYVGLPASKVAATFSEELLTEAWTQYNQAALETKYGLRDKAPDFAESFLEVYPQTVINTILIGGGAGAYTHLKEKGAQAALDKKIKMWAGDLRDELDAGVISPADLQAMLGQMKPDNPMRKPLEEIIAGQGEWATGMQIAPGETTEEDLTNLNAYLGRWAVKYGMQDQEVKVEAPEELSEEMQRVQAIGRVFGAKVRFYRGEGMANTLNGMYDEDSGTIFINESSEDPHLQVLGHESLHQLKKERPDLYNVLRAATDDLRTEFDASIAKLNESRAKAGWPPLNNTERYGEEYLADFAGGQFANPDFWEKLNERDPSLGARLAEIVTRIVNKIREVFDKSGIEDAPLYRNLTQVQDALAATYWEYARGKEGETGTQAAGEAAGQAQPGAATVTPGAAPGVPGEPGTQPAGGFGEFSQTPREASPEILREWEEATPVEAVEWEDSGIGRTIPSTPPEAEKPKTKREKSQKEWEDLVQSLTPEEDKALADTIAELQDVANSSPGIAKTRLETALAKYRKEKGTGKPPETGPKEPPSKPETEPEGGGIKIEEEGEGEKPTPPKPPKPTPTGELSADQKAFIEKKVKDLGSKQAVYDLYSNDSTVANYARDLADKLYAEKGPETEPKPPEPEPKPEPTDEEKKQARITDATKRLRMAIVNLKYGLRKGKNGDTKGTQGALDKYYENLGGAIYDLRTEDAITEDIIDRLRESKVYDETTLIQMVPEAYKEKKKREEPKPPEPTPEPEPPPPPAWVEPYSMTKAEWLEKGTREGFGQERASDAFMEDIHRASVKRALEEGKDVGESVLADYEDLKRYTVEQPAAIAYAADQLEGVEVKMPATDEQGNQGEVTVPAKEAVATSDKQNDFARRLLECLQS